jgi:hypothetical protein
LFNLADLLAGGNIKAERPFKLGFLGPCRRADIDPEDFRGHGVRKVRRAGIQGALVSDVELDHRSGLLVVSKTAMHSCWLGCEVTPPVSAGVILCGPGDGANGVRESA